MNEYLFVEALRVGGIAGVIGLAAGFFLSKILHLFAAGYASEKGKNLATREDIEILTKLVEDVRHKFATDLEEQKAANQLRLAALDRRLQAHQEAFTLWRKLFSRYIPIMFALSLRNASTGGTVIASTSKQMRARHLT